MPFYMHMIFYNTIFLMYHIQSQNIISPHKHYLILSLPQGPAKQVLSHFTGRKTEVQMAKCFIFANSLVICLRHPSE